MKLKVTGDVTIRIDDKEYRKGQEFSADEKAYKAVKEFVEVVQAEEANAKKDEDKADSEELTVAQIKEKLDEAGIDYDAKAKKADLLKLLEG